MVVDIQAPILLVFTATIFAIMTIAVNLVFLCGLQKPRIQKTIINHILRNFSIVGCLLVSVYYCQIVYKLMKKEPKEIDCYLTPIINIFLHFVLNFEHGVCLTVRCLMLGFPNRIKNWSNKKMYLVTLSLGALIAAPYFVPFFNIKALLHFQFCSLQQIEQAAPRLGKTNAISLTSTLIVLLILSFVVLKLENKVSKKVGPNAGLRKVNIATAKAQILITISSIVTTPLPAMFTAYVLKSIKRELSIQIVPVLFFCVATFRYIFPPSM